MNPVLNTSPALFSVEGMVGVVFLVSIGMTLGGGLLVCTAPRIVRAVAGLIVCFVGVAGLYFFLNSPFVSMMQILIYVGAVAITISFAIMLASPEEKLASTKRGPIAGPLGMGTAILLAFSLSIFSLRTNWQPQPKINNGSMKEIGLQLLTTHSMVFELISVILLVAILGALIIAQTRREDS